MDAYVRVSKVGGRQGDSFISPDVQRDDIGKWAELRGVRIGKWHEDLDETGAKLDRPGFNNMLGRVESGRTGGVVVAKLDRFGRTVSETLRTIQRIHDSGAMLSSVHESLDMTTPYGQFAVTILLAVGELELNRISESWRVARARAIERGIHIHAPFGYKRAHDRRLIPDSSAEHVAMAFSLRFEGRKLREIAEWLNERSKPTRGDKWTPSTVGHMLQNRAYLGEAFSGEFVCESAHPAIVRPDVFAAVQPCRRKPKGPSRHLLVGILRCAGCRHTLRYHDFDGRTYYRCIGNHASGKCTDPTLVDAGEMERTVTERFLEHVREPGSLAVSELRDDVRAAKEVLAAYRDDLRAQTALGYEEWLVGLETRAERLREAAESLRDAPGQAELDDVVTKWEKFDLATRRERMAAVVDCVFVKPAGDAFVCWAGEAPAVMPIVGNSTYRVTPFQW